MNAPPRAVRVVRFELAPRTILSITALLAGLWLAYQLWLVLLVLVVALVFVGTFNPLVEALEERGLERMTALIALIVSLSLGASVIVFLTVPPLLEQLGQIVADLPGQRLLTIEFLGRNDLTAPFALALKGVDTQQAYAGLQDHLVGYSSGVVGVLGYAATTFFLAFYILGDGKRAQGALYAVVPRAYHMRLARIVHNLESIVGGYMRGQVVTSLALAAFVFILLSVFGARNALALALFAALMDVLPFVGGLLAAVPVVLTAAGRSQTTGVAVLACMFVYQEFENKVLVPKVYGNALRLSPEVVVLALLAGATLLGMLGALLALPIAAGLQMIVEELGVDLPGDDSDDSKEKALDETTEAAYEVMSAGSTAPEAGQIASELAHDIRDADAWVAAKKAKESAS